MRPKAFTYTIAALDVDGFLDDATGTGPFTTMAGAPGDGLAHLVSIISATDLRTWTFTIVGTDANGRSQTEAITGGNANTEVLSTKYYATLTSVTASKTLGAATMDVGWTAVSQGPIIPLDRLSPEPAVVHADIGGTINYTLNWTVSNVFNPAVTPAWIADDTMTGDTADEHTVAVPVGATAVRLNVASHSSGTITLSLAQVPC